jgi:hypothetical protein
MGHLCKACCEKGFPKRGKKIIPDKIQRDSEEEYMRLFFFSSIKVLRIEEGTTGTHSSLN